MSAPSATRTHNYTPQKKRNRLQPRKLSGEKFSAPKEIARSRFGSRNSAPKAVGLHTVRSAPASQACELDTQTVTDSIAYRRVPKTYLSVQDRELLSAHTKRPARNGHYSKTFNGASVLTTACACHGVHTPAHQVSENRPRNKLSQTTIIFYIRVELLRPVYYPGMYNYCLLVVL